MVRKKQRHDPCTFRVLCLSVWWARRRGKASVTDGLMMVVIMEHEGGERERLSNGWEDEGERSRAALFMALFFVS